MLSDSQTVRRKDMTKKMFEGERTLINAKEDKDAVRH